MRSRGLQRSVSLLLVLAPLACGIVGERRRYSYSVEEFRQEVRARVPDLADDPIEVPFEIAPEAISLALAAIRRAPHGHERIVALVDMLHAPPPDGLGLRYSVMTSQNAAETLKIREGNCVALASVLVGLGRGLGWPVFYGEALIHDEEIHRDENLAIRADHMVVVIVAQTVKAVVDFTGPVEGYGVRIIDDLQAYAHLLNNRASEQILDDMESNEGPDWERALAGFSLAARITPELARAWNNQGVALARLGRLESAREAYDHALRVDAQLDSPHQNLIVLETRARGETGILQTSSPDPLGATPDRDDAVAAPQ